MTHDAVFFMLYRDKRTTKANDITWYREERASTRHIARSEQFYCHLREKRHILDVVLQEATATSVLLRHIPKGDAVIACKSMSLIVKTQRHNIFLMLRKAVVLPGCNDSGSTIARREEDATIKFFMLSIKG